MKISIITITKNSEKTLEETIKSIINQTQVNYALEYIIVDGKSTDNTIQIINKYENYISKWISEEDEGISDAFNKGIALATGDLIGIINSDDLLLDNTLETVALSWKPEIDVIYGNGLRLDENGNTKIYKANPNLKLLYSSMQLVHPAVFIKREAYKKYDVYDKNYKCVMDRELLLRFYRSEAVFKYIDESLIVFRDGGVSSKAYFSKVLPEEEQISIKNGMSPLRARINRIKSGVFMRIVFIKKSIRIRLSRKRVLK